MSMARFVCALLLAREVEALSPKVLTQTTSVLTLLVSYIRHMLIGLDELSELTQ